MEASFPYRNFTKEHRGLLTSFWTCEFSEETTNTKNTVIICFKSKKKNPNFGRLIEPYFSLP